jgi:nucleotide-binding universal stress UspA family protein
MFKHILVATDGSAASEHAARLAVELARIHDAQITAVYVVDPYPYLGFGDTNPMGFNAYMSAAHEHAAKAHTQVAQLCTQGEGKPVALELRLIEDAAAVTGIVKTASDVGADLIVLGSHGRSGLNRMLLGSVAAKVVAQSPVPVLIAR